MRYALTIITIVFSCMSIALSIYTMQLSNEIKQTNIESIRRTCNQYYAALSDESKKICEKYD